MKKLEVGRLGILAAMGLIVTAVAWSQEEVLRWQQLSGCELDIRPFRDPAMNPFPESQLYWDSYKDEAEKEYGVQYKVDVPDDDMVEVGDAGASNAVLLDPHMTFYARVYWDLDDGKAYFQTAHYSHTGPPVSGDWTARTENPVLAGGFDKLGELREPTVEYVRRNASNKKRVRVRAVNYGIEFGIAVSDY